MELLSVTNNKTQLHKSQSDLSIICEHAHKQSSAISSDISFFLSSLTPKCFAQTYKTDSVEIWRVKASADGTEKLDRVRKIRAEGIQAISCSKNRELNPEYAVGSTTGTITIRELSKSNKIIAEFDPDPKSKASVVSLDYSSCGKFLSSVYENGIINIYGLTTKIKTDTIVLDKDSSLARFNPVKLFHIAVASYTGSVTVYDIASKKIHFQDKKAHDAPCRDIAIPEDIPDRMLTCGCDSVIKIFDTRKKGTGLQIQSQCGLSTISVSKCGEFFAVGNLKGEVLTYDMRSLRQPLAKMKVDTELVTRIMFMPTWGESNLSQISSLSSQGESIESKMSDDLPDPPEVHDDFTMEDILRFQKGRISELDVSSRVSTFSARSDHAGGRISENFGRNIANALKDLSFSSDASFIDANSELPEYDHFGQGPRSLGKKDSISKRRSSYMPSPLQQIREECSDKENMNTNGTTPHSTLGPRFSSTPTTVIKSNKHQPSKLSLNEESTEIIDVDALDMSEKAAGGSTQPDQKLVVSTDTVVPSSFIASVPQFSVDFRKEFDAIHEKVHFEVNSLNYDLSYRNFEMMSHITNQRVKLEDRMKMVEECIAFLMNDDVKINRIMELQEENREIRQQLSDIMRRLNM